MSAPDRQQPATEQWRNFKRGPTRGTELLQLPLEERQRIARLERIRGTFIKAVYGNSKRRRSTI